jgi:pimeloyl-ACP methyl ester carboxylesterase
MWPGTGVPVVLVHGLAASGDNWARIPAALASAGHPVMVVDLPGHGASERSPGRQDIESLSQALASVIEHAGLPPAHVVGHSLGGAVAIAYAHTHPDRVQGLTLNAAAGLGPGASALLRGGLLPGADLVMHAALTPVSVTLARGLAKGLRAVGARPYVLSDSVLGVLSGLTDHSRQDGFLETLEEALHHEGHADTLLAELATIPAAKVHMVWCQEDPILPTSHGHAAHALLPGSTLTVFSGFSHEPHSADPDRFVDLVVENVRACELAKDPARDVTRDTAPNPARVIAVSRPRSVSGRSHGRGRGRGRR